MYFDPCLGLNFTEVRPHLALECVDGLFFFALHLDSFTGDSWGTVSAIPLCNEILLHFLPNLPGCLLRPVLYTQHVSDALSNMNIFLFVRARTCLVAMQTKSILIVGNTSN